MLEESMKLKEILQDAVSQRAEQYLEQDNQRQPKNSSQKDQWRIGNQNVRCHFNLKFDFVNFFKQNFCWKTAF